MVIILLLSTIYNLDFAFGMQIRWQVSFFFFFSSHFITQAGLDLQIGPVNGQMAFRIRKPASPISDMLPLPRFPRPPHPPPPFSLIFFHRSGLKRSPSSYSVDFVAFPLVSMAAGLSSLLRFLPLFFLTWTQPELLRVSSSSEMHTNLQSVGHHDYLFVFHLSQESQKVKKKRVISDGRKTFLFLLTCNFLLKKDPKIPKCEQSQKGFLLAAGT